MTRSRKKTALDARGNEELIGRLTEALDLEVAPAQPSGAYARLRKEGKTVASIHPRNGYVRMFWGSASGKDVTKVDAKNLGQARRRLEKALRA